MMRLYLISVCCLGVWELSRHELKEHYSIGIDIRLEAVGIVILHPNNLRSLGTYRQNTNTKDDIFVSSVYCVFMTQKVSQRRVTDHPENGSRRLLHLM